GILVVEPQPAATVGDTRAATQAQWQLAQGQTTANAIATGRLAQSATGAPEADAQDHHNTTQIEEIVVTAQKRAERLQDVPVPVSAVIAQKLVQNNQTRMQDFYTQVPGLSISSDGYESSRATIAIRGITTVGFGNPTVGVAIDDVPLGSTLNN